MNSKEALETIYERANHDEYLSRCNIDEASNFIKDNEKYRNVIEKDLEVLDILKKYLYYDNKNHFIKMKPIRKSTLNFDYEDLKE